MKIDILTVKEFKLTPSAETVKPYYKGTHLWLANYRCVVTLSSLADPMAQFAFGL